MRVGIHQPNFMPWFGYFNKIYNTEKFVFLDNVECSKNSYFNRNRFKSGSDVFWLTIPISKKSYSKNLKDVSSINTSWVKKHIKYFKNSHSKTCEKTFLESIICTYENFLEKEKVSLTDFNIEIINNTLSFLDIDVQLLRASELNIDNHFKKQDLVLEILKRENASCYISGIGAKSYQKEEDFISAGIDVKYNVIDPTIESESIIDLILREGRCKTLEKMILL